jgi:hypothetical protein
MSTSTAAPAATASEAAGLVATVHLELHSGNAEELLPVLAEQLAPEFPSAAATVRSLREDLAARYVSTRYAGDVLRGLSGALFAGMGPR